MTAHPDDPSGTFDPDVPGSAPHMAEVDTVELVTVVVPPDADQGAIARALLAVADNPADVQFGGDGYVVPMSVAVAANLGDAAEVVTGLTAAPSVDDDATEAPTKAPARKAPARKAPAKKAAAKPTTKEN